MKASKLGNRVVLLSIVALLAACGGGAGDEGTDDTGADGGGTTAPPTTNQTPVANAGADQTLNSGLLVTLNASASTDADGTIASYAWTQIQGPTATLSGATTSTASFTAPSVTATTTLIFRLTVTDNRGATSTDNVSVTINATSAVTCPTPSGNTAVTQTQTLATLYNFQTVNFTSPNGSRPENALVEGPDGHFYGVSRYGGIDQQGYEGDGLVFRLTRDGVISRVHTFEFVGGDAIQGDEPVGGLVMGNDCHLYGTTYGGWNGGSGGSIFKMTLNGAITYLAGFAGGANGLNPVEKLVQGADGNFYGTTTRGGAYFNQVSDYLTGTVFRMTPSGTLTTLVSFNGTGGGSPVGALVEGSDGNFYGVTRQGGTTGEGTIYKVSPQGQFTLLHSFQRATGQAPRSGLVQGNDGNFYGTTWVGGAHNSGAIYKITPQGQYTLVHSFNPVDVQLVCNCGPASPLAGLLLANDGNFYGTTTTGASASGSGEGGAVFRMSPQGMVTPIAYFPSGGARDTLAELIQGRDGHLYGLSYAGGTNDVGAFYRVLLPGGAP